MARFTVLFWVFMGAFSTVLRAQENWSFHDGSVQRTGYVETTMAPPFMFDRKIETVDDIEDFSITDGILYFIFRRAEGKGSGALDLATDQILWTRELPGIRGTVGTVPVASGDIVYVGGQNGLGLYALDKLTGDSLWLYPAGSLFGRNPAIFGDRLFLQPGSEGLVCLDKLTGKVLWSFGDASGQTVPTVDQDHVYYTTRLSDTIYALTHEGAVVWKYRSEAEIDDFEAIISKGDTLFMKTRGYLLALNRYTGEEFWNIQLPDNNSFISTNNTITWTPNHLINHEWIEGWQDTFKMQGYDLSTGQLKWSHTLKPGASNPATAFGDFLVQNNESVLEIRTSLDGQLIQSISGYYLVRFFRIKVLDGQIFAATDRGVLVFKPIPTRTFESSRIRFEWDLLGNPVADQLQIQVRSSHHESLSYRVISSGGELVPIAGKLYASDGTIGTIDLSTLPSGNYFIQLCQGADCDQKQFSVMR